MERSTSELRWSSNCSYYCFNPTTLWSSNIQRRSAIVLHRLGGISLKSIHDILSVVPQKALEKGVFVGSVGWLQVPIQACYEGSMGVGKSPLDLVDTEGVPPDIVRCGQRIFDKHRIKGRGAIVVARKVVVVLLDLFVVVVLGLVLLFHVSIFRIGFAGVSMSRSRRHACSGFHIDTVPASAIVNATGITKTVSATEIDRAAA